MSAARNVTPFPPSDGKYKYDFRFAAGEVENQRRGITVANRDYHHLSQNETNPGSKPVIGRKSRRSVESSRFTDGETAKRSGGAGESGDNPCSRHLFAEESPIWQLT